MKKGSDWLITENHSNFPLISEVVEINSNFHDLMNRPYWEPPLVTGLHSLITGMLIRIHIILIALRIYINPLKVIKVLRDLESLRRKYMGDFPIKKLFKIDGRYYWDMHAPGWPSKAFIKYNEGEMNRIITFRPIEDYLNSMIFAITKKCPLNCQHCYEWGVINQEEKLTLEDLKSIIDLFQSRGKGLAQIQLSGGEPLSRYSDIIELLLAAKPGTDYWLVSSGYNLTPKKAEMLKSAGLCGIAFSLDHFNEADHNAFRGSNQSYHWILEAIKNAHGVNLVVILSLCVTKEFTTEENLMRYAEFAKHLGAAFILLVEPRAVGRYAGKDVFLSVEQEKILEDFYLKVNFDRKYRDLPAVSYHGYHQRRIGCFGGSSRYVYVDTDGNLQTCPFCQKKYGNVLNGSLTEKTSRMKYNGCQPFKQAEL